MEEQGPIMATIGSVKNQLGYAKRDITANAHKYTKEQFIQMFKMIQQLRAVAQMREKPHTFRDSKEKDVPEAKIVIPPQSDS